MLAENVEVEKGKWFWCPSKEQYTCQEVCDNNLAKKKCIHTDKGCKLNPKFTSGGTRSLVRGQSISKERKAAEERYGIRFGQTEIYCSRCGRPVADPLNHTCRDIQLQKAQAAKKNSSKKTPGLIAILNRFERKMVAIMLEVPPKHISHWIERGNVPKKYHDSVRGLVNPAQRYGFLNFGENAP